MHNNNGCVVRRLTAPALRFRSGRRYFVFVIFILVSACATLTDVSGRMYNLKDASIIRVSFQHFLSGHGRATAKMPDGELLIGEYTLRPLALRGLSMAHRPEPPPGAESLRKETSISSKMESGWSQVYGFGSAAKATPMGTATLVGSKGTVIQIVFYMVNYDEGTADGMARSNAGTWYRVHVGKL